jgi:tRNA 2-selenouridine synthase
MREDTSDYRQLFLTDVPLLDVRAPVEFDRGAFPNATNLPLLDDLQREQIGTRYKHAGQEEAIRLGLRLATPEIRRQRLDSWMGFSEAHPEGYIYCFRGGLRSRTTQQWMREAGVDYPLVRGGYKAMRRFLLDELEASARHLPLVCVGGLTGVGKTRALRKTRHHVDFEGLANHRGSAFGRDPLDRQPAVIDWENRVSIEFLKHRERYPGQPLLVEDEGRCIGRVNMPDFLYEALLRAPRAILEAGLDERIAMIRADYIEIAWPAYLQAHGETAEAEFSRFVLDNLARIRKRLGGERYQRIRAGFENALQVFFQNGDARGFDDGIRSLLEEYYDPMYRYQIDAKQPEIVFRGNETEFLRWAEVYYGG